MKKLLLFLIMPFFTACTPSAPKMQTVYEINIDSISEALPELAQIKYVPLETTDSSLIGNIDRKSTRLNSSHPSSSRMPSSA